MNRARLIWTREQQQWLREEIEIRRWYAKIGHADFQAMYVYEVAMLQAVQRTLDDLLYPPEIAVWSWWSYWWSACWISMLADRENEDGIAFRRLIVQQRNERLAALPPRRKGEVDRPVYMQVQSLTTEGSALPLKD